MPQKLRPKRSNRLGSAPILESGLMQPPIRYAGVAARPHHSRAAGHAPAVAGAPGAAAPQCLLARSHPVAGVAPQLVSRLQHSSPVIPQQQPARLSQHSTVGPVSVEVELETNDIGSQSENCEKPASFTT